MKRRALLLLFPAAAAAAKEKKLSNDDRLALLRGLTAEYAKAKLLIPRSKKPLAIEPNGKWDKDAWEKASVEFGPAARVGEMVQITKVHIEDARIDLELNNGLKTGAKWYDHVQVGMGNSTAPISGRDNLAKAGTNLAIVFPKNVESLDVAEVKKILGQVLDFEMRSVTESYMEKLPEPVRTAIQQKRVIEGMDREQVRLAVGQPVRKERRIVDGDELEDWMYGRPPGKVTFVTFTGRQVTKVKDMYAGLGGSTAPELPVQ